MKSALRILLCVAIAASVTGCGRAFGLRCEDPERYTNSGEVPPIQIPDDLDPPDETASLRIPADPPEDELEELESRGPCLESPPDFFEAGAPG
ncbi:MAG: hypothetical protein ACR2QQ_15085 [Gammaproteobacteria bacterium]